MLESIAPCQLPQQIFGDKAYDSQGLQQAIAIEWQIDFSAPLRALNKQIVEKDQNDTHWQKSRWKVEQLFAWLKCFRRINARWEYHPENFLSWIFIAASLILFFRF